MGQPKFKVGDLIWPSAPIDDNLRLTCGTLSGDFRTHNVSKLVVKYCDEDKVQWISYGMGGTELSDNCCSLNLNEVKKISSKGNMNKLTVLAKKIFDADTRTFVKAGVLDEGLEITEFGISFLLTQYLFDNKVNLAKEAKKLVDEAEAEKE